MGDTEILKSILNKLDSMDARLDSMDTRLDRLESGQEKLEAGQKKLEERFETLESKVDLLEKNQDTLFLNQVSLHEETQNEIRGLKAYIENDVKNNIALLAENHLNLIDKLNQNVNFTSKNSLYEFKVNMCFEKISQLEKEIADLKAI